MKIQLITQNIQPVIKTETNSNPILKNSPADSFERQSKVAFKGEGWMLTVLEPRPAVKTFVDEAFKSKVLASIAKKGEEGLEEICTNMPTFRNTLTVVRDLLEENRTKFWGIIDGTIPTTEDSKRSAIIKNLVEHHNNIENADVFWRKLWQKGTKSGDFIETMLKTSTDRHNLILPIMDLTGQTMKEMMIQPYDLREFQTVEEWVTNLAF